MLQDWRPQGKVAYGGDYNPEQWPRETWAEDLALMKESRVNLVTPGVFAWAELEPEPGGYRLDWLEEILDGLHRTGVRVDLATATASPPVWLARRHPDSLPVDREGHRLGFGSRQQYCPTSPEFRTGALNLVRKLAEHFGEHPALAMWHISNEYGCHVWECFCERCVAAWQVWLTDKYGSIDALNQAWGTNFWSQKYTGFDQVGAPGLMPTLHNPGQATDWRRYSDWQIRSLYEAEAKLLREITPQLPITTNFMGDYPLMNYADWARGVDVVSDDSYPDPADPASAAQVAYQADLMRGLGSESAGRHNDSGRLLPTPRSFLLMEQTPTAVQWRKQNSPKRPGQLALWSIARWARGADGILHFQWRQSRAGAEAMHGGMVHHAGKATANWRSVVELGEQLSKLPAAGQEAWPTAPVAIVMDWDSEWVRNNAVGPLQPSPFQAVRDWHRSCFEAGIPVDLVRPGTALADYQLVIVPELYAITAEFASDLSGAAKAGAQVLVAAPTGICDPSGGVYLDGYLGPLRELLGLRVLEHYCASPDFDPYFSEAPDPTVARISSVVQVPAQVDWCEIVPTDQVQSVNLGRGRLWSEEIELSEGTEVYARFGSGGRGLDLAGRAAFTRRENAWYLATDLDQVGRAGVLELVCNAAGVKQVVPDLPAGLDAVKRPDGTLVILNYGEGTLLLGDLPLEESYLRGNELLREQVAREVELGPRSAAVIVPQV